MFQVVSFHYLIHWIHHLMNN